MRTLIYKCTHHGDPDALGQFGIHDCMKSVRARDYGAVIGIGGIGDEPRRCGIAEKINWISIGPHKYGPIDRPLVTFDHFLYLGENGPLLREYAPTLSSHVYDGNVRVLMSLTGVEQLEMNRILALAKRAPPSREMSSPVTSEKPSPGSGRTGCVPLVCDAEP